MRKFETHAKLAPALLSKLAAQTKIIEKTTDPKSAADRIFGNARKAKWFKPVINALKSHAGLGQRCMLCSGSEASDVEHYRPKAVYPLQAMTWENYLWSCTPCNRLKASRFPPETGLGGLLINPLIDDVWLYFFIDEFGMLTPVYDRKTNTQNPRALTTEEFLGLNREALQETRLSRLLDLRSQVRDTINSFGSGAVTAIDAKIKIQTWRSQPFQPDVADYFLNGPGRSTEPFKKLFDLI